MKLFTAMLRQVFGTAAPTRRSRSRPSYRPRVEVLEDRTVPTFIAGQVLPLLTPPVLNAAVSAYYSLRLIVVMFFRERATPYVAPRVPASIALALVITIAGVFYLGIFPGRVLRALSAQPTISVRVR